MQNWAGGTTRPLLPELAGLIGEALGWSGPQAGEDSLDIPLVQHRGQIPLTAQPLFQGSGVKRSIPALGYING